MNEIVLSKSSSTQEIKAYFNAVLELSKTDNEFPINLDEVWMLVYPRKDHAVRALEENFIKDVDYVVFPKNGENPNGGRPTNEYRLSVPCMEYFIARKVRPVFEVYRQVFHKAVQSFQVPQTFSEALMLAAKQQQQIEEQQQLLLAQGSQITEMQGAITEMQPKTNYCDIILKSPSTVTVTQIAQDYGMSAKAFNKLLHSIGVQRKVGRQWVLYAKYIANGYVQSHTEPMRNSSQGRTFTYSQWTQKGRIFLYHELRNRNVLPVIEQTEEKGGAI